MTRAEEIKAKEARVRSLMDRLNLKGILLKTVANFSWFTAGGTNEVTIADTLGVSSILITQKGRFILASRIEAARMMEDEKLAELGFELLQYEWYSGDERRTVGEIVNPENTACDAPGFEYRCIAEEITELRYSLLPPEIERYRWLGRKASLAIESALTMVKPGMRESMLTAEVLRLLWYDRIDSVCNQSAADDRSRKYRHPVTTEQQIDKYLMLNVNARKWGLVTTVTRAVHIGRMSKDLRRQYNDTVRIECGMIAASRPGSPLRDIFKRTQELYRELGYPDEWKYHHQGGAQGYRNRDYLVFPDSDGSVADNQCFCWNPSIAGPEVGTKSEDAFIAQEEGPLMITEPVLFPTITITVGDIGFVRPGILEL